MTPPDEGGAVILEPPEPEPVVDLEAKVAELEARRSLANAEIVLDARALYPPSGAFERRYHDFETRALTRHAGALRRDVEILKAIGASS